MRENAVGKMLRGFTLVEVLVVILLIGILAAILISVVGSVRQTARSAGDAANLRSIATANHLYAIDNENRTVIVFTPARSGLPGRSWMSELRPYLAASENERGEYVKAFVSPADPSDGGLYGEFAPNSTATDPYRRRSYSLNYTTRIGAPGASGGGHLHVGRKMFTIDQRKLILAANHNTFALGPYGTLGIQPDAPPVMDAIPRDWHGKKGFAQFVFMDGRVEMIAVDDVLPGGKRFEAWEAYLD